MYVNNLHRVPLGSQQAMSGTAATYGNSVRLLVDAPSTFPVIYGALNNAKSVINISMFSLLPDGTGAQLAEVLKRKARQGVEVNVQVDTVGSYQIWGTRYYKFIKDLESAGVHVSRNDFGSPWDNEHVDHRKLYVIDGKTAFIGGMNLGERYDGWHDVMVELQGPAVAQAAARFVNQWTAGGGTISGRQAQALKPPRGKLTFSSVAVIENLPGQSLDLTAYYLRSIQTAKKRVWISTPYLGDERFATALAAAAKRGVDVRVYTTSQGAKVIVPGMTLLSRSFYPELLKAGVKVFEEPRMAHAKVMLVDDAASVGSMNLTRTSAEVDRELNIATATPQFVRDVENMFRSDEKIAKRVAKTDVRAPLDYALGFLRKVVHVQH